MENLWIGIIVVVVIIIIIYLSSNKTCLNGVWVADDDFCDMAEVDMMALVLTNGKAFILVMNGEGAIDHLTSYTNTSNTIKFKEGFEAFPKSQSFKMNNDRLIMMSGKTIHFAGYRDPHLSSKINF